MSSATAPPVESGDSNFFSYPLGVYEGNTQVAVARIASDNATFAWLCDVFVDTNFRGRGIGTWLAEAAVEWADRSNVKKIVNALANDR